MVLKSIELSGFKSFAKRSTLLFEHPVTAIVGPNGIAFTHPRGLAIGGPGSKIYSVPESTDLEQLALLNGFDISSSVTVQTQNTRLMANTQLEVQALYLTRLTQKNVSRS